MATLQDIADHLHIAKGTVSKAFTIQKMDRNLRQRIHQAILGLTQMPPVGDIKPMEGKPAGRFRRGGPGGREARGEGLPEDQCHEPGLRGVLPQGYLSIPLCLSGGSAAQGRSRREPWF